MVNAPSLSPESFPPISSGERNFTDVFKRLPPEQRVLINKVRSGNNPEAAVDFLALGTPETIPLLFSILISNDGPESKGQVLTSLQAALTDPFVKSEFSKRIPTDPDTFFENLVVKAGTEKLNFTPSPEVQRHLATTLTNYHAEMVSSPTQTQAGKNLNILTTSLNPDFSLLETVITGVLDSNYPEPFRAALMRTLLFLGSSRPQIFSPAASYRHLSITELIPKIMGTKTAEEKASEEKQTGQNEVLKLKTQLQMAEQQANLLKSLLDQGKDSISSLKGTVVHLEEQLKKSNEDADSFLKAFGQERRRVELLELLLKGKMQAQKQPVEKDPYELLEVPKDASREEITRAYRELAHAYHPDIIGAILAKAEIDPSSRRGKAIIKLASEKMKEINLAYEKLVPKNNKKS